MLLRLFQVFLILIFLNFFVVGDPIHGVYSLNALFPRFTFGSLLTAFGFAAFAVLAGVAEYSLLSDDERVRRVLLAALRRGLCSGQWALQQLGR